MLNLKVKVAADGTKMVFYLTNVTNAVNLSQPNVCIGGGLHAPIHISQPSFHAKLPTDQNRNVATRVSVIGHHGHVSCYLFISH